MGKVRPTMLWESDPLGPSGDRKALGRTRKLQSGKRRLREYRPNRYSDLAGQGLLLIPRFHDLPTIDSTQDERQSKEQSRK